MKLEKSSSQELYTLSEYLLINAINERNKISLENNNYYYLKEEFYDTSKKALNYYNNLCNFYPFIKEVYVKPKKLFMSEIMSNQGITGFYSCFTMEPIINGNMPDIDVPFSMCHELSHTSGFMREDEANYISYLACINSNDPYFSYSGYLSALNMCASKLYSSNYELFCKLYNSYTNEIKMDNNLSNLYWDKYLEKETAKIHDKVNDVYLKINNQSSGVQSYGEMVDLLLADFKSKI